MKTLELPAKIEELNARAKACSELRKEVTQWDMPAFEKGQPRAESSVAVLKVAQADGEDLLTALAKIAEDEKAEEKKSKGREKYRMQKYTAKFKKVGFAKIGKVLASVCKEVEDLVLRASCVCGDPLFSIQRNAKTCATLHCSVARLSFASGGWGALTGLRGQGYGLARVAVPCAFAARTASSRTCLRPALVTWVGMAQFSP